MTQSQHNGMGPRRRLGTGWRRPGMTLLELLIVIAIITVLVAAVSIGGKAVHGAMRRSTCEQQLRLIQDAISAYAKFWPRWEYDGVVIADQGWPDFIPTRLFAPIDPRFNGPFQIHQDPAEPDGSQPPIFNDPGYPHFTLDPNDPRSGLSIDPVSGNLTVEDGAVEYAAECLAYGLSVEVGKGPFISDKAEFRLAHSGETYPQLENSPDPDASQDKMTRSRFVDPWGTPYRYFWVYADPEQDPARKAYKGLLPVPTADMSDPNFGIDTDNDGDWDIAKKAIGYVLESAGPDKKFGNVWKQGPTEDEIQDADDNLMVKP